MNYNESTDKLLEGIKDNYNKWSTSRVLLEYKEYEKILDEMYVKFEYLESEIIKIENGIPVPNRDR